MLVRSTIASSSCDTDLIILIICEQERFIEWVNTHDGVEWARMIDIADSFRAKALPAKDARMPTGFVQ